MKTTKRVLAVLLALALGLALFAPVAMAADPVITGITPQNAVARTGKSITFTVEAQPPEDAESPLTYQWYQLIDGEWQAIEGATSKSLTVTAAVDEFISGGPEADLANLYFGLIKQYRTVVTCGEGQSEQAVKAVFVLSFLDGYSGVIKFVRAGVPEVALSSPSIMLGINFGLIIVSPILFFTAIRIWFLSFMMYGIL